MILGVSHRPSTTKIKGQGMNFYFANESLILIQFQMARMVATKASLSIRVDALTDADGKSEPTAPTIGLENRAKLESRLRALEHQNDLAGVRSFGVSPQKQQTYMTS